jgi:hypothetical protein
MEKSYVTMEQQLCVVTGKPFDTNSLLLDQSFKKVFDKHTITGWGFSPEVQEKIDEGYVALVEIDGDKSEKTKGVILPQNAYRLGRIVYIKKHVLEEITGDVSKEMAWVEPDFLDYLVNIPVTPVETNVDNTQN